MWAAVSYPSLTPHASLDRHQARFALLPMPTAVRKRLHPGSHWRKKQKIRLEPPYLVSSVPKNADMQWMRYQLTFHWV
jgi:hypothetical protein